MEVKLGTKEKNKKEKEKEKEKREWRKGKGVYLRWSHKEDCRFIFDVCIPYTLDVL